MSCFKSVRISLNTVLIILFIILLVVRCSEEELEIVLG